MKVEQTSGFWWHWQNLKEDSPNALLHGRAWLHKRPCGEIEVEWCVPTSHFQAEITFGGNHQVSMSFACWLFAFYLNVAQLSWLRKWKVFEHWTGKEISFSVYSWAFWWKLWINEHEWDAKTPKWRDGAFHIDNFFLGKHTYRKVEQLPLPAVIPMSEGDYAASVIFFSQTWKRPRWPIPRCTNGATVEVEGGIPIPGKGENSWDCDDSAFISIGTSATTVEEAIQAAIDAVNKRRERYGGSNWVPERKQT
jgi:hypothetical protein